MMPHFSNLVEQADWLFERFLPDAITEMVLWSGWRRSHILMLVRLHSLPELHPLIREGRLTEKQVMRLTNVVRSKERDRILKEMLKCELSDD